MKLKDRIIRKLLNAGKKHRILVYPTLVLVAVISAVSNALYWGKSNKKKLVASVMIMVMLVTQSVFLTSSAGNGGNADEYDAKSQDEPVLYAPAGNVDYSSYTVTYYRVDENNDTHLVHSGTNVALKPGESGDDISDYKIDTLSEESLINYMFSSSGGEQKNHITIDGFYLDPGCTSSIGDGTLQDTWVAVNNSYNIYFKATRNSYPVRIVDSKGNLPEITETAPATPVEGSIYPEISYTVKNAADYNYYMTGYSFAGLKFNNTYYAPDTTVVIPVGHMIDEIALSGEWEAMKGEVSFDAIGDNPPSDAAVKDGSQQIRTFEYTYGSNQMLPSREEFWAQSDAYTLSGWKYNSTVFSIDTPVDTTLLFDPVTDVTLNPNITGRRLTAIWAYKNIHLSASDDGVVSSDGTSVGISGSYGDDVSTIIQAIYNDNTQSEFTYSISQADIETLGSYGLGVTNGGTYFKISGQIMKVTNAGGVSVTLTVTDNKAVDDPSTPEDERVSEYIVTLNASKKQVTIDPESIRDPGRSQEPYKSYNGDNQIAVSPRVELEGVVEFADTGKDNVYLTVDGNATLLNEDAGYNKDIKLTGVKLAGDEDKLGNYVLTGITAASTVEVYGVATVYPKYLSIGIKLPEGEDDTVLYGEDNPSYVVYLKNPEQLPENERAIYEGLLTDDDKMLYIESRLGAVSFSTQRVLYSNPGTYDIAPVFNSSNKNYAMAQDSDKSSFTVTRDEGIMYSETTTSTANFRLSTDKSSNGFYPGLTITPYGEKYNRIRMFTAASQDIYPAMSKSELEGLFTATSVDVPDMVNGTVYIQMYSTLTGAVTQTVTLSNLNVDTTGPSLEKYSVSPEYFYFNKLPFGAYFHSQTTEDGAYIDSLSITFEYSSEGSGCDSLYYSFVDENGDIIGNLSNRVQLIKDGITGRYKAGVTIHPGEYGQLVVYAVDETGNKSVVNKIKVDECVEYIENNPVGDGYYEWMVENTIDSSFIQASAGGSAAVSDTWYNSLNLSVDSKDDESGVNSIEWIITDPSGAVISDKQTASTDYAVTATGYGKVLEYTFNKELSDSTLVPGNYVIKGILMDNAGNRAELDEVGPFLLDTKEPVISDNTEYSTEYVNTVILKFTVTEGEDESGVASVVLYKKDGSSLVPVETWSASDSYEKKLTESGEYVIQAADNAGNIASKNINLNNVSNVTPDKPVINITGTTGNNGWYISDEPEIQIKSSEVTRDNVPVTTHYKIITEDRERESRFTQADEVFTLKYEGSITIEAWAESASGVKSEKTTRELSVDVDAPEIYITESATDDDGRINVKFRIVDEVSGVNKDKVTVNGNAVDTIEEQGAVTGSFDATYGDEFVICAEDNAGNISDEEHFNPLTISVNPITGITETGAYLEAFIYKGTYDIADAYITLREDKDSTYSGCLYNKTEEGYGLHLDARFNNLKKNTVYWYKIYAKTKTSNEVKTFEGSFRTSNPDATGSVAGTVSYAPGVNETYPVYVSLYEGNTVVASDTIESAGESAYRFDNVNDGVYRVVATNGKLTKTGAVTVENGGIVYPEDYALNGGINLVLNAMSTSVVIKDNAINISADGLEKIYDTTWYEGAITPDDKAALAQGGTIDICLYADNINVTEISPEEQGIFASKLGKSAVVERYIRLYIIKEVRDANGNLINGTPSYVSDLYDPVTISFPLGSLSGQKIYVASIHNTGNDYTFINWDSDSDMVLSKNYVTVNTNHFSIYALYRMVAAPATYTVKWVDGDGKVMKTETVEAGSSATPPTQLPTKTATEKYIYTFSGWDTDYSKITKDTIIAAWFTAKDRNKQDNNVNAPDATIKPGDKDNTSSNTDKKYTYMDSTNTPNTGDTVNILLLAGLLFVSLTFMVVMAVKRKRTK